MTGSELQLTFVYPPASRSPDPRTLDVAKNNGSEEAVTLYKFFHPNTVSTLGVTTLQRINPSGIVDTVCHIEWATDTSAKVLFGTEDVIMKELRREKKPGVSKSRRFRAGNGEYKWKVAENGNDLVCVSTQITSFGKNVAEWSQESLTLRVAERAEGILDRIVITCFLNIWMKRMGRW